MRFLIKTRLIAALACIAATTTLDIVISAEIGSTLVFPQLPEHQLDKEIQQRFGKLQEDPHFTLPFLPLAADQKDAERHAALPSLSFAELVQTQVKGRVFRWVNRGDKIGIEMNRDYYAFLVRQQQSGNYRNHIASDRTVDLEQEIYHIEHILQRGNFVEIAHMPQRILPKKNDGRVIVTYSFPRRFENKSIKSFDATFLYQLKQALDNNPYIDFVYVDEDKDGVEAAIKIIQARGSPREDGEGRAETGYTEVRVVSGAPVVLCLSPQDPGNMMHTFLHELMHALGLPHHWDAWPELERAGNPLLDKEKLPKDVLAYKEEMHATYAQTLPDSCNEAYTDVRPVKNQNIRTVSAGILSVLYHLKDRFPKGVVFKFMPNIDAPFHATVEQSQQDGSKIVNYIGFLAGITLSNPGSDFTDLDFRNVPAFIHLPGGYKIKGKAQFPNGVTAFLGPDANITFNTFIPINEWPPEDKNMSIDLYTTIRRVHLSPYDDWIVIPDIMGYENVEIYPGLGNDDIRIYSKNQQVIVDKYENQDIITAPNGGHIVLGYNQDELHYYKRGDDLYLLSFERTDPRKPHGICLKDQAKLYTKNLVIKDDSGKVLNLKSKKFVPLPENIQFPD